MDRMKVLATSSPLNASSDSLDDSDDLFVGITPTAPVSRNSRKSRQSMGLVVPASDDEEEDDEDENFDSADDGLHALGARLEDVSIIEDEPSRGPAGDGKEDTDEDSFVVKPKNVKRRVLVSSDEEDNDEEADKKANWTLHRSRRVNEASDESQDGGSDESKDEAGGKIEECEDVPKESAEVDIFDSSSDDVAIEVFSPGGKDDGKKGSIDLAEESESEEEDDKHANDESFVVTVDSESEDDVRRGGDSSSSDDESQDYRSRDVPSVRARQLTKQKNGPKDKKQEMAYASRASSEAGSNNAAELEEITDYIGRQEALLRQTGRLLPDKGEKIKRKIATLEERKEVLEKVVAAEKKEQRRKDRGYEEPEVFLVEENSLSDGAGAVDGRNSGRSSDEPRIGASAFQMPVKADPQATYGKVGPQRKVLEHLLAADPNQHKLFGGRMNDARHMEVKTVTHDMLYSLHEALKSMPTEDQEDVLVEPKRLKMPLMTHQRHAVTWGLWRESQNPPGGILADDMGLGKTFTMIALAIKSMELSRSRDDGKENSGWLDARELRKAGLVKSDTTLIVCPASCMGQWENEIKSKVSRHPSILQYHGASRKRASPRTLADYDFVITTYGTVQAEVFPRKGVMKTDSPLLAVAWYRIILDEAHVIRNPKSQTAEALCKLRATRRWCLTGTPIHNKELDMFSLLKFMRMAPFDEYEVWKRFVDNSSEAGTKRLNLVVKAILLRRTKSQVDPITGKTLVTLPPKVEQLHSLELTEPERRVHGQILAFSKSTLEKFLEDKDDIEGLRRLGADKSDEVGATPFLRIGKSDGSGVKVTAILVLLLRLRQICCHPKLLWNILNDAEIDAELQGSVAADHSVEDQLMAGLQKMSLADNSNDPDAEARRFFSKDNPMFDEKNNSTKITALLNAVKEVPEGEKIVVVSQWSSMLDIVEVHLKRAGIRSVKLTGSVPVVERTDIVTRFNSASSRVKVLLLSLTAGGVGLNLVGGNHLFLVDVHWNPQLEAQACDRIYRVGQTKPVFIHRFICKDTIEEKIRAVQAKKLALAEGVLTGAKKFGSAKLTINDLIDMFSN